MLNPFLLLACTCNADPSPLIYLPSYRLSFTMYLVQSLYARILRAT